MRWFRRKPDLLVKLLELEERRLDHRSELEAKRDELEVRKLEIELGAVKQRTEAQIELEKARAELRERRREIGRRAAKKRWERERGGMVDADAPTCPLCANPAYPRPTVEMIRAHDLHSQVSAAVSAPTERGN